MMYTVAVAVRVEFNTKTDDIYLVFQITDPVFKNRIKKDWREDIEMVLDNKELKIIKE